MLYCMHGRLGYDITHEVAVVYLRFQVAEAVILYDLPG